MPKVKFCGKRKKRRTKYTKVDIIKLVMANVIKIVIYFVKLVTKRYW